MFYLLDTKKSVAAALICAGMMCLYSSSSNAADETPIFVQEAREATMTFQKALKRELMSAMKSGGPKKAVEVCHSRAPEIAEDIGEKTGWEIGRTSLKTRNEKNMPSDAERAVLEEFEQRKNNGEAVSTLEWWQENEEAIAYMKAIPMKGMCASCHGSNVSPSLKQHINQFYPHDMATGFEVGDIRGAFTLKKYLEALNNEETQ
jgi:hypothetical protein